MWDCQQAKLSSMGFRTFHWGLSSAKNGPFVIVWGAVSKNNSWACLLNIKMCQQGCTKNSPRHYAFRNLPEHPEDTIFPRDGAAPPFSGVLRWYLHKTYYHRCIGRASSISLAPWSLDLTACDSISWKYLKHIVYHELHQMSEMKVRSKTAVASTHGNALKTIYKNMENRFSFVLGGGSAHFKHLFSRKI